MISAYKKTNYWQKKVGGTYPSTTILLIAFVCLLPSVLTGSEDVDKWEATVKALESLVRKNPAATREVK